MKVAAIVPSLNPDEKFAAVVRQLAEAGFPRIIVVNDGSSEDRRHFFEEAAALPGCTVLTHEVNKGKGRALKTAFAWHLDHPGELVGVVTLDGDGQHSTEDVLRTARALEEDPGALVLGVRDFSGSQVPAHNRLGNRITSGVFKLFCGLPVSDTQTGLRGVPNAFCRRLLEVPGERFEFETDMLLETKQAGLPIREIPIRTIYIDDNQTSHFRLFADSARIYLQIIKYSFRLVKFGLSSLLSAVFEFSLFALLNFLLGFMAPGLRYLICTVVPRTCSAILNFTLNRKMVFASAAQPWAAFLRYAVLCVTLMGCSYGGLYLVAQVFGLPTLLSKVIVDGLLFFFSFFIQRVWVFRPKPADKPAAPE